MKDKEEGKIEQADTKLSTFEPTELMVIWKDMAIQCRKLSTSDVAEYCSTIYTNKSKEAWRQVYYDLVKIEGFRQWFLTEYAKHFKSQLGAKAYARLHDRIDLEKDMSKIIQVLEHVEGVKKPGVMQQFNVGTEAGNAITFVNFKDESKG